MQALGGGSHHLRDFAAWVDQQRAMGTFKGEVCGPLGLDITLRDMRHAKAVEAVSVGGGGGRLPPGWTRVSNGAALGPCGSPHNHGDH